MNSLLIAAVMGLFVSVAYGKCEITAKAYGSGACLISLGSDTFGDEGEGVCFANNVDGYSSYKCLSDTEIAVYYYDTESDCNSGTSGTEADFPEDTCTYSKQRGFYVKSSWNSDCCSSSTKDDGFLTVNFRKDIIGKQ